MIGSERTERDGQQDHQLVIVESEGAVRRLTLNRPERRNAFTVELYRALTSALQEANNDQTVSAVVLTGSGSVFCAGTDLGELDEIAAGRPPEGAAEAFPQLISTLARIDVPLIAAVNGAGVGLGFTILAYCDLVYISDLARLRAPFVEMGVPPEAASSYLLPARMGWQRASAALLTGQWLSAAAAVDAGIVTEVCRQDDVLARAMEAALQIAKGVPGAVRTTKRLMQEAQYEAITKARTSEDAAYGQLFAEPSL
jgi:enoyl-CoA hydratase/carnithine racemase